MTLNQTALFAQIHGTLLAAATQFPPTADCTPIHPGRPSRRMVVRRGNIVPDADYEPPTYETTVFTFGTLKIKCGATRESILEVAAKYHHIPAHLKLPPPPNLKRRAAWENTRRPSDADAKLAALEAELAPMCDLV